MNNTIDYNMPSTSKNLPGTLKKRDWCESCICYHSHRNSVNSTATSGSERSAPLIIDKDERKLQTSPHQAVESEARRTSVTKETKHRLEAQIGRKAVGRNDRSRRPGRIGKRSLSTIGGGLLLRGPRKTDARQRRRRVPSTNTEASGRSSAEGAGSPVCRYCGHRCCARRYLKKGKSYLIISNSHQIVQELIKKQRNIQKNETEACKSKSLQTNLCHCPAAPAQHPPRRDTPPMFYSEVTPEMVRQALADLTKWTQHVKFESILSYLQRRCPVNRDAAALARELREKLREAAIAGSVVNFGDDAWQLTSALECTRRCDHETAATRFWKAHSGHSRTLRLPTKPGKRKLYKGEDSKRHNDLEMRWQCACADSGPFI